MRVFLVNKDNPIAMSLIKKLSGAVHGQIIPVTSDEFKFVKSGSFLPIDLPDLPAGKLSTTVDVTTEKKLTESPKPQGTSLKSPGV
jgi:hypothetical protein